MKKLLAFLMPVLGLVLLCPSAWAAITKVQEARNIDDSGATASTIAATFASGTGAGNLIVVWVGWDTSTGATLSSVTDGGDTFSSGFGQVTDTVHRQAFQGWYAVNVAAGRTTVTVTFSTGAAFRGLIIQEYSGVVTNSAFDGGVGNLQSSPGTGSNAVTSTAITTTTAGDLVVGSSQDTINICGAGLPQFSAGTNFTGDTYTCTSTVNAEFRAEHLVQASAGSIAATFTLSANTATTTGVMAFKANVTAVKLISFTATRYDGGVLLRWQTGYEVNNLGFHIYREAAGERVQVNPSLVAGSALFAGAGTVLTAGRGYIWRDQLPENGPPAEYWLEDVDLNGQRTLHGPISPSTGGYGVSGAGFAVAPLLSRVGVESKTGGTQFHSTAQRQAQPMEDSSERLETQWAVAAGPAVRLGVREEGWYRVEQPTLVSAGLDPDVNPRNFRLFVDGEEVSIMVLGEERGRFGPPDAIEFYGVGLDTPSTDVHTYFLTVGSRPGKRLQQRTGRGEPLLPGAHEMRRALGAWDGGASSPVALAPQDAAFSGGLGQAQLSSSFPFTVQRKDRTVYFAALTQGSGDNFFGPVISTEPVEQALELQHVDRGSSAYAQLEVSLQGVTLGPHRVDVRLNGNGVGRFVFQDQQRSLLKVAVPEAWLQEGQNQVELAGEGGETDVSLVDYVRLTYQHLYVADADTLRFTAAGGHAVTIHGFSDWRTRLVDITDPDRVRELVSTVRPEGLSYSVTAHVPGSGVRTVLAFTEAKIQAPATITAHRPSSWHSAAPGASLVMISNGAFLSNLYPLKSLHEKQELSVAVIDVAELYDEFSFGAKDPRAVKDFLFRARTEWRQPPRFLLLVGDATFDPRNYLGLGDFDFLPTKLVDTRLLQTASDDWFVEADGETVPEIPVGRLPVRTAAEAETVVSKIMDHEQGSWARALGKNVLLVADRNDGFDFEAASAQIKALLPGDVHVSEVLRGQTDDATASSMLLGKLNEGQALVNYLGHGSVELWRGNLLTSEEARTLTNGSRLPFVAAMTCLNGYFQDLYTESLAEAMLLSPQGGAVAVWASSGLTEPGEQAEMDLELIRQVFGNSQTLGEATVAAKKAVTDPDIRHTWILFGDPATKLK
jgi:hypothetical protein